MAAAGRIPHLEIFGDDYPTHDGTCIRDYVHVTDLADAHVRGINFLAKGGQCQPVNLGTGQGFSIRQIITAVEEVTNKVVPYVVSGRRAGDPAVLVSNPSYAAEIIKWNPSVTDLDSIINSAYGWLMQQLFKNI